MMLLSDGIPLMRQIIAGVYQITNEINGKFYIGSSVDVIGRWARHRHSFKRPPKHNSRLHAAVTKYGIENFTFSLVETCEPTKESCLAREQYYLDLWKPEYNILPTAGSNLGFRMPPSFFEKRRGQAPPNKGVAMAAAQRFKLSEIRNILIANGLSSWNKGKPMSDEHRAKREASGFWTVTEEKRQHQSESHIGQTPGNKGKPWSNEQRRKASEASKQWYDPEHQKRMTEAAREANTGKKRPDEVVARIKQSNLESEARKAFAESRRGVLRPEVGQKVSDSLQTSEKAAAYHQDRIGKSRGNNPSGHYGVIWDKSRNQWQARIRGKLYGRFDRLEDAITKVEEVMSSAV